MLHLSRLGRRIRGEEEGVALVAVVGVMAIGLILASLILSSLISGLSFTAATRASVQSQATAEAGIAAAQAGLQITGDCASRGGVYTPATPTTGLNYRVTVWIKNVANAWVRGCPASTTTSVRLIAEGNAGNRGVPGNNSGDKSYVEAVFNVNVAQITEGPSASAIFTGSGGSVSSISVTSANSQPGDIHILKGDFNCNGGSVVNGSIIVADGNAFITNSCTITGSVKASKAVKITSSVSIGGDVVAAGGAVELTNTTISVAGSVYAAGLADVHATIAGDLQATGNVTLQDNGWVKKNIIAGGSLTIRGKVGLNVTSPSTVEAFFRPAVVVGGSIKVGGNLKVDGLTAGTTSVNYMRAGHALSVDTYLTGLAGPAAPVTPAVTPWVDWTYKPADWTGFNTLVWPSSACQVGSWNASSHAIWKQIANLTSPTLIDATGCANLDIYGVNMSIKTDVVFIVKGIQQGSVTWSASDNAAHKLWFLTSDASPTVAGPQCNTAIQQLTGSFEVKSPLKALVYTPCTFKINQTKWRGQIYAGGFEVSSGDSMVYEPIGIPGTDLSGGTFVNPNAAPAGLGDLTAIRNRTDNGEPG